MHETTKQNLKVALEEAAAFARKNDDAYGRRCQEMVGTMYSMVMQQIEGGAYPSTQSEVAASRKVLAVVRAFINTKENA